MQEQLEKQISEIAKSFDNIYQASSSNIPFLLVNQKTLLDDLVRCLRAEMGPLDFPLFNKIMVGEEYDTEIHYDCYTRRACNRILMLKAGEELPTKFEQSTVYLKKKTDGTIEEWWYQNGEKRGVHTHDSHKVNQIINLFTDNALQEVTVSLQKKLFNTLQNLCSYTALENKYQLCTFYTPEPIKKLKEFFDSTNYTIEEKQKIEKIIIFAVFLQAARDLFTQLNRTFDETSETSVDIDKTKRTFFSYLGILDNMAYKYHPDAYRFLSFLAAFPIALGVPLTATFACTMLLSPLLIGLWAYIHWNMLFLIAPVGIASFIFLFFFVVYSLNCVLCPILFPSKEIQTRWNLNWAYRLPEGAIEEDVGPTSPKDIGISAPISIPPNAEGFGINIRKASPGASFKAMNQLGFFPFKETAKKVMEVTETIEKNLGALLAK